MYDAKERPAFSPVPQDRPLTKRERRLTEFTVGEIVYIKGMAMRISSIEQNALRLVPPSERV